MDRSTKLLIFSSMAAIFLGLFFLWFGLKPTAQPILTQSPTVKPALHPEATSSATQGIEGERALVTRVVDGDTIDLENGQTVRFLGMDTPETVDPRRPVGCFGKEASNKSKDLLSGKVVILQKDVSDTDKYGRILRYIYLQLDNGQILFVNDYLVREGFARVLTYPPDIKFDSQLREAETQAKINKKGLWGKC